MTQPFVKPKRWLPILCLLVFGLDCCGCRGPKAASTADAYTFRVGDLVTVDLRGISSGFHKAYEGSIKEDGTITLPDVGAITFANKTVVELHEELTARYSKYYETMRVWINSYPNGIYYIGGEVKQPGPKAYLGKTTITVAIQEAGGFTESANVKEVVLSRPNARGKKVNAIAATTNPSLDLPVYPGDRIDVPRKWWR